MSRTERLVFGAVGLLAVAAVAGVFWLVVGELSPAQPVAPTTAASEEPAASEPRAAARTENPPAAPPVSSLETATVPPVENGRPKRGANPKRRLAGEGVTSRATPELGDKGSVAGRVIDGGGGAVAGAKVSLLLRRGSFLGRFDDEKTLDVDSGADGAFRLGPLDPGGRFIVKVRHPKFAEEQVDGIAVKAGEETVLADIQLTLGAGISGRVADTAGVPIAGAKVIVESGNFFGIDVRAEKEGGNVALSGTDGTFAVRRVSTGSKNVYCWARGYAVAVRRLENVEEGVDATQVDFSLALGKTISGSVTDEDGRPVPGADVYASPVDYKDASRGAAKTDDAGRYVLEDLSEGQFHVFASAEGFTRPDKRTVPAGSEGIDFKLAVNGGISGHVIDLATSAPITNFTVRYARTKDGKPMGFGTRQKCESPEGAFEIDDLDPGRYQVQVSADGYATKASEEIEVMRRDVAANIVVALDHGAIVRGIVLRASDRSPVAGASVALRSDGNRDLFGTDLSGGFGGGGFRRAPGGVRTGVDGRYVIENVSPSEYALEVSHDEFAPFRLEGVVVAESGPYEAPEAHLVRGGTVSGIVRGEDGLPDGKSQVTLTGARFDKKTRTDAEGRFTFDKVPPGEYVVAVTMRGGQVDLGGLFGIDDDENTIVVRDGENARVDP